MPVSTPRTIRFRTVTFAPSTMRMAVPKSLPSTWYPRPSRTTSSAVTRIQTSPGRNVSLLAVRLPSRVWLPDSSTTRQASNDAAVGERDAGSRRRENEHDRRDRRERLLS